MASDAGIEHQAQRPRQLERSHEHDPSHGFLPGPEGNQPATSSSDVRTAARPAARARVPHSATPPAAERHRRQGRDRQGELLVHADPPNPRSWARMIASARPATWSLAKMAVRLLLTVLGERNSSAAISCVP